MSAAVHRIGLEGFMAITATGGSSIDVHVITNCTPDSRVSVLIAQRVMFTWQDGGTAHEGPASSCCAPDVHIRKPRRPLVLTVRPASNTAWFKSWHVPCLKCGLCRAAGHLSGCCSTSRKRTGTMRCSRLPNADYNRSLYSIPLTRMHLLRYGMRCGPCWRPRP